MARRIRSLAGTLFLCLASCLIGLVVTEAILRMTLARTPPYPRSPGPNSAYQINTLEFQTEVVTNDLNLRDQPIGPRRAEEFRILFLGDSFTFGLGVEIEDTFVKQVENGLRGSRPLRTINAGGRGTNASQQYSFLRDHQSILDPDLLVLQVYIGNDFHDSRDSIDTTEEMNTANRPKRARGPLMPQPESWLSAGKQWVRDLHLYTPEVIYNRLLRLDFVDDLLCRYEVRYGSRALLLRRYPSVQQQLVAHEIESLTRITDYCAAEGIRIASIIIPYKLQVFKKNLLDSRIYDYRKPNALLTDFFRDHEVPCIDFLEQYQQVPESDVRSFYYFRDAHWTVRGHQYAARKIQQLLLEIEPGLRPTRNTAHSLSEQRDAALLAR